MGTFRIFEELSQVLEPPVARKLTGVLDAMYADLQQTVTKSDFEGLKTVVSEFTETQKGVEARLTRLEEAVAELAEAQKRTEQRVSELAEAQKRTEQRVSELAEAQKRTEQRVSELAEAQKTIEERLTQLEATMAELVQAQKELAQAQRRTEEALCRLIERVDVHEQRLAKLDGRTLEMQFRDKASAYLGGVLRRTRVVSVGDLADDLETVLTSEQWEDLRRADVILQGRADVGAERREVYVVVEVSVTVEATDVERAARRAALLRKKGWKSLAVAAGENAAEELISLAAYRGVAVLRDGQEFNWPQALAAA